MSDLQTVVSQILDARRSVPAQRSVLAAITGIDGCGKGYVTARIVNTLRVKGVRAAAINIDGWPMSALTRPIPPSTFTFMRSASRRCSPD